MGTGRVFEVIFGLKNISLKRDFEMMLKRRFSKEMWEAGTDEAGRGALAGPVVAAAVILPKRLRSPQWKILNDSKQLNENLRYALREVIMREAAAWRVAFVPREIIDEVNILNASILAMHRALKFLPVRPEFIIVDGNRFKPFEDIPHETIVNGDEKYLSIAAASVLAKTFRDDFMKTVHRYFPYYRWDKNKGYATPEHKSAIREYGICRYHRLSFHPHIEQLKLPFD